MPRVKSSSSEEIEEEGDDQCEGKGEGGQEVGGEELAEFDPEEGEVFDWRVEVERRVQREEEGVAKKAS